MTGPVTPEARGRVEWAPNPISFMFFDGRCPDCGSTWSCCGPGTRAIVDTRHPHECKPPAPARADAADTLELQETTQVSQGALAGSGEPRPTGLPARCDGTCSRCDLPASFTGSTCACECHGAAAHARTTPRERQQWGEAIYVGPNGEPRCRYEECFCGVATLEPSDEDRTYVWDETDTIHTRTRCAPRDPLPSQRAGKPGTSGWERCPPKRLAKPPAFSSNNRGLPRTEAPTSPSSLAPSDPSETR